MSERKGKGKSYQEVPPFDSTGSGQPRQCLSLCVRRRRKHSGHFLAVARYLSHNCSLLVACDLGRRVLLYSTRTCFRLEYSSLNSFSFTEISQHLGFRLLSLGYPFLLLDIIEHTHQPHLTSPVNLSYLSHITIYWIVTYYTYTPASVYIPRSIVITNLRVSCSQIRSDHLLLCTTSSIQYHLQPRPVP